MVETLVPPDVEPWAYPPPPGASIAGRYRVGRLLGRGGMGSVHEATDTRHGGLVAVKSMIAPSPAEDSARVAERKERLLREARSAARVRHECVVKVVDCGDDPAYGPFVVMERIDGVSLQRVIEGGAPLQPWRAIGIACQVLAALQAAHDERVLHRDIKPGNVMVLRDSRGSRPDQVKVVDFGIARALDDPTLTGGNGLPGTPAYMSPEHLGGEALDARADLYSTATMLFQMLTGALPYPVPGGTFDMGALIRYGREKMSRDAPPATRLADGRAIPPAVQAVLARGLCRKPGGRPSRASDMASDLAPFAEPGTWADASRAGGRKTAPALKAAGALAAAGVVAATAFLASKGRGPEDAGSAAELTPVVAPAPVPIPSPNPEGPPVVGPKAPPAPSVPEPVVDDPLGEVTVRVPPGSAWIGSSMGERGRDPDEGWRLVEFPRGFEIGVVEVSQALWASVMGQNPADCAHGCGADYPVQNVSWLQAIDFCNRLSASRGLPVPYRNEGDRIAWDRDAGGFRLPTEAEWEYAARAGSDSPFAGAAVPEPVAWFLGNAQGRTHAVGGLTANARGLYDMSGNVREWVWDAYLDAAPGEGEEAIHAPRVLKGGAFSDPWRWVRVANRDGKAPDTRAAAFGLRLARSIPSVDTN